jgi:outer membrane protein OmpA-like peptidoglycan-associated protein
MTSLAVIFAVLLVAFANGARRPQAHPGDPADPPVATSERSRLAPVRALLEQSSPAGVGLHPDPTDPLVLRVVIPDSLLNFELGQSTLTAAADRFLADVVPPYAAALCGSQRDRVEALVIEGHTDDLGGDTLNLRLSQERSLSVLVRALEAIRASAPDLYACFSELASASGRGRQDLIYDEQGRPNRELSRRVVLKILLRSDAGRG